MVIALLLLIVAIMLFGSSAVIGIFGWIAGFLALCASMTAVTMWLHSALGYEFETIMYGIFGGLIALVAIGNLAIYIHEKRK